MCTRVCHEQLAHLPYPHSRRERPVGLTEMKLYVRRPRVSVNGPVSLNSPDSDLYGPRDPH